MWPDQVWIKVCRHCCRQIYFWRGYTGVFRIPWSRRTEVSSAGSRYAAQDELWGTKQKEAKTEVVFWNNVCGNAYPARFGGMTAYPHNVIWFMLCLSLTASVI